MFILHPPTSYQLKPFQHNFLAEILADLIPRKTGPDTNACRKPH